MALSRKNEPTYAPIAGLKIALPGAVILPGLGVGEERGLNNTQIEMIKPDKTKILNKEEHLSYSSPFYHHKNFHSYFLF